MTVGVNVGVGVGVPVGVKAIDGSLPTAYSFAGNYPNPFNNATRFAFTLPTTSLVTFKIYDVSGQEVGTLIEGWMPQGSFELTFDAAQLPSGVYVARLTAGSFASTQKMVLLK